MRKFLQQHLSSFVQVQQENLYSKMAPAAYIALHTIWADSYILNIISLPIFIHRLDRLLIHFAVIRKFRSFNQQQHRADTALNSQTAAMLGVSGDFTTLLCYTQ